MQYTVGRTSSYPPRTAPLAPVPQLPRANADEPSPHQPDRSSHSLSAQPPTTADALAHRPATTPAAPVASSAPPTNPPLPALVPLPPATVPAGLDPLLSASAPSDPALTLIRAQLARLESKVGPSDTDLPPYISPFTIFQYTPDPNPKRIAPCSVPVFKRGVGTYFDAFLYSMEIHFIGTSAPAQMRVPLLISRIDPSHHAEMQLLQHLPYEEFTLRLRRAFREPNLSHACLSELSVAAQEKDESFLQFLERLRTLARRAFPSADAITLDYTVASNFLRGMADTKIARLLWGTGLDSNGLVQRATTIATGLRNRSERKKGTAARDHLFMLGSASLPATPRATHRRDSSSSAPSDRSSYSSADDDDFQLCAAAPEAADRRDRRPNRFRRYRPPPRDTPCPYCRELGHWGSDCPTRDPARDRTARAPRDGVCRRCGAAGHWAHECPESNKRERDQDSCDLCGGPHYMRACPRKAEAARLIQAAEASPQAGLGPAAHEPHSSRGDRNPRPPVPAAISALPVSTVPPKLSASHLSFASPGAFPFISLGAASGVSVSVSSLSASPFASADRDSAKLRLFAAAAKWFGSKLDAPALAIPRQPPRRAQSGLSAGWHG